MKRETREEAAENYGWRIKRNSFSDKVKANELAESAQQDFIAGAKWQAERMYSEDEVDELVNNLISKFLNYNGSSIDSEKLKWFYQQLKKK